MREGEDATAVDPPRAEGLVRRRLVDAVEPHAGQRLSVLVGTVGSGKTTVLQQWARRAATRVVWLRVPAHATPAQARQALAAALEAGSPPSRFDDPPDLREALASLRETVTVVLDEADRHPDAAAAVDEALGTSPRVRAVLAGRALPAVNLARGEVRTRVLGDDELRFSEHEVGELLRDVLELSLHPHDVARLTRHVHGWAAGLELVSRVLRTVHPEHRGEVVARLGGRVRYARDHLHQQVLSNLPAGTVEVLRSTSPLARLSPDLCRELGCEDTQWQALAEAESRCTMLGSPDAGRTLQLHPVLRAHLLTELRERIGDQAVDARLGHAARLLAAQGLAQDAAEAWTRAGAWGDLRDHAAERGRSLLAERDLGWVDEVPEVELDGWLHLVRARHHLRAGRLVAADRDATAALADLRVAADGPGTDTATRTLDVVHAWLLGRGSSLDGWQVQLRAAFDRPLDVLDRVQSREHRRSRETTRPPGSDLVTLASLAVAGDLAQVRRQLGTFSGADDSTAAAARLVARVLNAAGSGVVPPSDRAGGSVAPWFEKAFRLCELATDYEQGTPPQDPLGRASADSDRSGDPWAAVLADGLRAAALLRAGRPDVPAFEVLCERLRLLCAPGLEAWARSGLALASAAVGLPEAENDAESAAAFAQSCQVPGALALAHFALAGSRVGHSADLVALARAEATAAGLDLSSWQWMRSRQTAEWGVHEKTPPVDLRCFGVFELTVHGVPPALGQVRPRAREVLRLLAVHAGRPVHREEIVEALWPALEPTAATHNLHVAVSSLRTTLEPGVPRGGSSLLLRQDDRYALVLPAGSTHDLGLFDEWLRQASRARTRGDLAGTAESLAAALEVYRDDVLPEDGPSEWVVGVRDRYRSLAAEAAGELAEVRFGLGQHHLAAAAARRSVDIDPWRDSSWRALTAACTAAGDIAAAERARADYREILMSLGLPVDSSDLP